MKIWIHVLIFAASSLAVYSQTCPSGHYSAIFTAAMDTTVDSRLRRDPDLTFFKTVLKFRDSDIQHTTDDAIQFFYDRFGLDFSNSPPDENNQRFIQNATMSPIMILPEYNLIVTDNHWIRTGNTYSSCYFESFGGFGVTFSGEQTLYGSYGGADGKPAGVGNSLNYAFISIDVCKQSPLLINQVSRYPSRFEPIDGTEIFIADIYNNVLGHGTAHGLALYAPDPKDPETYYLSLRFTFVFPSQ